MANYKVIGGNLLTQEELDTLKRLLDEYEVKIKLFITDYLLEIHIKQYDTTGKRKRYCLTAKIKVPRIMFETEVMDWDFTVVIHKSMKKLLTEMKNKFRK